MFTAWLPDDASGPDVQLGRINADNGTQMGSSGYFTWKLILALVGALILAVLTLLVVFRRRVGRGLSAWARGVAAPIRRSLYLRRQRALRRQLRDRYAGDRVSPDIAYRSQLSLVSGAPARTEV